MRTRSAFTAVVFRALHSVLGVAVLAMTLTCLGAAPVAAQRPAAPVAAQQPLSMDRAIEQVGGELSNALRGERRLRLAVSDLLDLHGVTTVLGRYVAERLTTRLSTGASWYSVMERRRVGQVLDELNFGAYDLIQAANARRFGRMIGVDAIVVGTLSVFPERVDVDVRIVDIESSQILGAAQATMRRTSGMSSMLMAVRTDTAQLGERSGDLPRDAVGSRAADGIGDSTTPIETRIAERFRRSCDGGNMEGCANLGGMYADGLGVTQNETRAVELYQRACAGGNMAGCVDLGWAYANGRGVEQNDTRAAELYQRACDGGDSWACANLGLMYATGRGVAQNDARAVELFRRACDGGDMQGCGYLGAAYADGRGVAQSETRAVELFRRACDGGDMEGCSNLGLMYATGRGVAQSETRAVELYRRACDGGHSEACDLLRRRASPGVRP